jgi:hypothetical protein
MNIHWVVQYNDGTQHDSDESGEGFKYQDIDRECLTEFAIMDGKKVLAVLHLNKDCRLIYRRRVLESAMDGQILEVVYLFGWQKTVGHAQYDRDINTQVVMCLFEDGHIEVVDRFREDAKWFDIPTLRPEERKA